jgi:hypothetical protein
MRVAVIVMTIVLSSLTAFADGDNPAITKHYAGSLLKVTEKGLFGVELMIKGEQPKVGTNAADIILHDRNDRDVPGAEITVTPWMPSMGHGVFEKPVVTERGGGLYSVENIHFIMEGPWELKIAVRKDDQSDMVTFEFPDVKGELEHHMMHAPAPADLDLSTTSLSAHHVFRISYASKLEPIVINKIHSWELKVETPDGSPVSGAEITVGGDMPQHGHGLPTEPEVVQELGAGSYLIGGMKFSMPGWWVLDFHVKAGDKEDTVHFNLLLK